MIDNPREAEYLAHLEQEAQKAWERQKATAFTKPAQDDKLDAVMQDLGFELGEWSGRRIYKAGNNV